ncbi:MAG: radical SAM protein [Acidobacteriota bacterium]
MSQHPTTFQDVVRKSWEQHLLFSVLLELTYRCNLNCFFCYNDLSLKGQALSLDGYDKLLSDLADLQVFQLVVTGGEPLAHPDFFAIGAKARDLGFVVRLKSNGHALSGDVARRVREEVDPFLIEVSLHGSKASTHERQTRVEGSFDRLLENIRSGRELGLRFKLQTTLTRWNEEELEDIFELATDLGVPIHVDPVVTPRDGGDTSPLSVAPSREGIEKLLRLQREAVVNSSELEVSVGRDADQWMPKNGPKKHCGAGAGGVAIDPFGNVYPCVQWRRPVGNVHEHSIQEIWHGSSALEDIRSSNEAVKEAIETRGAWGQALNFCPGTAEVETGSPLGIYGAARTRADLARGLAGKMATPDRGPRKSLLPIVD